MIRRTSTRRSACGPQQHQMKVCYDLYGRFQQIPFDDITKEGLAGTLPLSERKELHQTSTSD